MSIAAVLVIVWGVGFVIWTSDDPAPVMVPAPPAAEVEAPTPPPVEAPPVQAPAPKPAPPPDDGPDPDEGDPEASGTDLFAGEMPDFMAELHMRVLDGKSLAASQQKQLYDYGQEHKDDARPQLLLAWDSMQRDWDGIAVRMYGIAFRADPRAKDDPTMLRDLLKVISKHDRVEYREGCDIIEEAYGAEAIPQIEARIEAMRASGKVDAVHRLEQLKERLSS